MPAGRPTSYREEYAEQAYKYALLGATDAQMAVFFDVTEQTLNNWKNAHPEFFETLKRGKVEADALVAEKLFTRAMGYEFTETKHEGIPDPANPENIIGTRVTTTTKHITADTTAQIFWLKNRQRDKWNNLDGPVEDDLPEPKTIVFNVAPAVGDVKVTNAKPAPDAE